MRTPNAHAFAERVIRTPRRDRLDHMIVLNDRRPRRVLRDYVEHYIGMRPHRTLHLDSPDGRESQSRPHASAQVRREPIFGGLLNEYDWAA